ncbi:hypothetical protein JM946_14525 [Steroidobacter sp. S1-65]|uniref:Uncharacterized protein n=1 Tax=Steroidobacter gossypii TaxID=2805490 RepID=A0ABS1WY91_9GAMM|nr:hypothetical protein [Steroidobacter gossypii]MBM0105944.1 hypothetical protein [Steroidobacter gossypii]
MPQAAKRLAFTLAASLVVASCAKGEYAILTLSYPVPAQSSNHESKWPTKPLPEKISKSFWAVAEASGYKCRAHVKRVEEITCRGPRDMYVTFKPALNKPEFVAKFNWLDFNGRTPEEFKRHVQAFSSSITTAVDDESVQLVISESW